MKQRQDWDTRKHRRWLIECDEEKLRLIASSVEDISRFLAGQPEMMNCLMVLDNGNKIGEFMHRNIKPMVTPELDGNSAYSWNGGRCPNKWQRGEIAQGYACYKSILQALAHEYEWHNTHSGPILTCEEGGSLMRVRPVDEENAVEVTEYWLAANPDGKQCIFRSKPTRTTWANGDSWEPQEGGYWYSEELWRELSRFMHLPRLTWEDEPYKFTITTPKQ